MVRKARFVFVSSVARAKLHVPKELLEKGRFVVSKQYEQQLLAKGDEKGADKVRQARLAFGSTLAAGVLHVARAELANEKGLQSQGQV